MAKLDIVRSIVRSAALELSPPEHSACQTVTLSRECGSGGEEIARQLAEVLGVPYLDSALLQEIVREMHAETESLARFDEHVRTTFDDWAHSFFTGQDLDSIRFHLHLIHVLREIPKRDGGVIVGRGAHLVLPRTKAFRVRIGGSAELCADRLQQQEKLTHIEALSKVMRVNRERAAFIRDGFGYDPADMSVFDLVLSTDRMNAAQAVQTILFAIEQVGFTLPESAHEALMALRIRPLEVSTAPIYFSTKDMDAGGSVF